MNKAGKRPFSARSAEFPFLPTFFFPFIILILLSGYASTHLPQIKKVLIPVHDIRSALVIIPPRQDLPTTHIINQDSFVKTLKA